MNTLLANAYSAANSGDGLLVDLALDLLRDALPALPDPGVMALHPDTFTGLRANVMPSPGSKSLSSASRIAESLYAALGRDSPRMKRVLRDFRSVVSVGGGYLRFGSPKESAKTSLAHLPQISSFARAGGPWMMLPQSIGPLRWAPPSFGDSLRRARRIYLRDDVSMQELSFLSNISRMPDLAVLEIARQNVARTVRPMEPTGRIGVVVRPLGGNDIYERNLKALTRALGGSAVGLLQSTAGTGNDDRAFMRRVGLCTTMTVKDAVSEAAVDLIVSVRLHGSLQSILGGIPSIHLSYERKGFGAFQDLGVEAFVHSATHFDVGLVADQVALLSRDSRPYWRGVEAATEALSARRSELVLDVRDAFA